MARKLSDVLNLPAARPVVDWWRRVNEVNPNTPMGVDRAQPSLSYSPGSLYNAGLFAANWAPGAGLADAAGAFPGQPGIADNLRAGAQGDWPSFIYAGLQGLDAGADMAALASAGVLAPLAVAVPPASALRKTAEAVAPNTKQPLRANDLERVQFPPLEGPRQLKRAKTEKEAAKFPGAPPHVTSREAEQAAIESYLSLVNYGAPAGNWYKDEARRLFAMSGYRPGVADRATGAFALTSANTALEPNAMAGIRGHNQGMAGATIKTQMPDNNAKIQQIFDGLIERMGPKINPFHKHLQSAYEPKATRAVHDVWDMRAWGFDDKTGAPGEAQHRWMDKATDEAIQIANARKLGGRDDWDVDSLQAAAWTALKAEELGIDPAELSHGYQPFYDRNTAHLSVESELSPELQSPLRDAPPEVKLGFHKAQESIFTTPDSQDLLAQQVGLLTPAGGKYFGAGSYGGVSNPVTRIPVLSGIDNAANQAMEPASRQLIEATGAAHGLLRGQASVGYDFIRRPNSLTVKDSYAAVVNFDGALSGDEMNQVQAAMDEVFGPGSTAVTPGRDGANVLYFGNDNAGFQKNLAGVFGKEQVARGKNSGDLIGSDQYRPSAYMKTISANPIVRERLEALAPQLAGEMQRLLTATGGQWDKTYTMVLNALSTKGLAGVDELVKKGLVPAAVLGVAARLLQESETPAQGQPTIG